MDTLIGRKREMEELSRCMASRRSEFVVIYGRRRVGKTFLVRNFFHDNYTFYYVGAHKSTQKKQLENFAKALSKYGSFAEQPKLDSWSEAFDALAALLEQSKQKKKVIFIDEMPWIDNKTSDFVEALEYFWNSWVATRDDIVLVACGSATSWMVDKLVSNQGGLHHRITRQIYLAPFTLNECKQYLDNKGFGWDYYQVIQCYMVLGGVPYYLSLLEPNLSLPQNIDALFFAIGGRLSDEFDELYNSLFSKADRYVSVVKALSAKREGLTRAEVETALGLSGGNLTRVLKNLQRCDFIVKFAQFGCKKKNTIYRISDFYTLFYFRFIENNDDKDPEFWMHNFMTRSVETWEGFTFEMVCLKHLNAIKKGLGISGIATTVSSWRVGPKKNENGQVEHKGAQIDLIISRIDKMVHLCEMKFASKPYVITNDYKEKLNERMMIFRNETKTPLKLVHTMITPFGVAKGKQYGLLHSEITAKELFSD